jgi:hypothetical protein
VGYLGDMDFFNWERGVSISLNNEEEDEAEGHDALEDNGHDDNAAALQDGVNKEIQQANPTEDAVKMAIVHSKLDHLA